ncbi:hypothetical protein PFISCL1PPCAC_19283, partial [Pristionchus fissidentatus]
SNRSMSHSSTSIDSITGGYAKYRPAGNRVLADDSAVFSLDEDGDLGCSSSSHLSTRQGEKSRLVECPLDSEGEEEDEEMERRKRTIRPVIQAKGASISQTPISECNRPIGKVDNSLTRLTSSSIYDLDAEDGDSIASDELDLLPPISNSTNNVSADPSPISSLFSCCCKPRRVPLKCSIM